MKNILLSFLMIFGLISCTNAQKKQFSVEALNEKMLSLDGKELSLKEIITENIGRTVVIDVWASWCPDCIKSMPKTEQLQQDFPETQFVYLSYDKTKESWEKGIEKYNLKGQHYLIQSSWKDGAFKKSADIDWIPRYIVLDKKGNIALYRAIEADDEKLIEILKSVY